MNDQNQLAIRTEGVESRDLVMLQESNLITEEQSKALTVASESLPLIHKFKGPETRQMGRHYAQLTAGKDSPVQDAIDALRELDEVWDESREDFQKYRRLYFEGRLKLAKLNKMEKKLADVEDEDDHEILQAEIALERVELEALETDLAKGKRHLQNCIDKAIAASNQYKLVCKAAGKESFTEEDFKNEEIDYYVKTAFFYAAQNYRLMENQDSGMQHLAQDQRTEVQLPREVCQYFEALGITNAEITRAIGDLEAQRYNFRGRDFSPYFDGWLNRTCAKYRDKVSAAMNNPARLNRVQQLLNPESADVGKKIIPGYEELERGSATY